MLIQTNLNIIFLYQLYAISKKFELSKIRITNNFIQFFKLIQFVYLIFNI